MTTRLYLDTEFNGHGGELISMALVSPEGHEFYEVLQLPNPSDTDPWVKQHVLPVLGRIDHLRPTLFKIAFFEFIQQFSNPDIICDWNADAVHFCQMLSGHDYGSSLDFACTIRLLKTPPGGGYVSRVPHNALEDARALMNWNEQRKAA